MVYVDNQGTVRDRRPIWTPSGLYHFFLSVINFIVLLFRSLIDPTLTKHGTNTESSNYRLGRGGGGGGSGGGGHGRFDGPPNARPGRRMGGFGGRLGGGPSCPPMAGG